MSALKDRLRQAVRCLFPCALNAMALWRILSRGYGYGRSVRAGVPVDGTGQPIPWFTYPALEYLNQLDFRGKTVFEFGAGNSTLYWSNRAARVVSIEHDQAWYERIRSKLKPNCDLHLVKDPVRYPAFITDRAEIFDVIIVDGLKRRECCAAALQRLRPGGLIILDNADWHSGGAAVLRCGGLLEVDMTGFGPIAWFTTTTSFFFHRDFDFPRLHERQPMHGTGALGHLVD
ncbi:MAG: class I SAM-dependent methyltransferase [Opitutaceae bacterium]|nr:class I SAM-dependent methyltransferase [Opitutaceae bacterium]